MGTLATFQLPPGFQTYVITLAIIWRLKFKMESLK